MGRIPQVIRAKARNLQESWQVTLESCLANFKAEAGDDAPQGDLAYLQATFPSLEE